MKIILIRTSTDFLSKHFSGHFLPHFISVFFFMFPSFFLFPSSLSLSISQMKSQYTILPIFSIGVSIYWKSYFIFLLSATILFGFRPTLFRCRFSLISSPYNWFSSSSNTLDSFTIHHYNNEVHIRLPSCFFCVFYLKCRPHCQSCFFRLWRGKIDLGHYRNYLKTWIRRFGQKERERKTEREWERKWERQKERQTDR